MKNYRSKYYIKNKDIQEGILFFTLSITLIIYSLFNHYIAKKIEWRISPYLFPILIAFFILPFSLSLFHCVTGEIKSERETENKNPLMQANVLITVVLSILYCSFISIIGYVPATVLFLASLMVYLKEKRFWLITLISLLCSFSIYIIFGILLNVMLP